MEQNSETYTYGNVSNFCPITVLHSCSRAVCPAFACVQCPWLKYINLGRTSSAWACLRISHSSFHKEKLSLGIFHWCRQEDIASEFRPVPCVYVVDLLLPSSFSCGRSISGPICTISSSVLRLMLIDARRSILLPSLFSLSVNCFLVFRNPLRS